ncbi:unnamed protein product [Toxocara canis]|uniref:F-box domain-containing protein n=1 Tax=Toxocara canis TaxID=6265 RepID=A0A183UF52_TOXCA|nr:unnamed protein product [Toxocara canis]
MTIRFLRRARQRGQLKYYSMCANEGVIANEYTESDSLGVNVLCISHSDVSIPIVAVPCAAYGFHLAKLHKQTLEDLADKCILQILRLLNINDLCRVRLVNRRLNSIVQRHYDVLAKKRVEGMTIYGLANGELNFDRQFCDNPCFTDSDDGMDGPISCDRVWESSLKCMCLDDALRHVVVNECVCIESARFDRALRLSLQRSFRAAVRQLELVDCTIDIGYVLFLGSRIRSTKGKLASLSTRLADMLKVGNGLRLYRSPLPPLGEVEKNLPLLTNETLRQWSSEMTWPSLLALRNVKSCFSIVGVGLMIESYFLYCYRSEESKCSYGQLPILWNFGVVESQVADVLVTLRSLGSQAVILESETTNVVVVVRYSLNSPPLHIRMKCQK